MKRVLVCVFMLCLFLLSCSEDSAQTTDTTTPVLTVENVAEVVQTFNYTSRKIDFPDIPEDVTPAGTLRRGEFGSFENISLDGRLAKLITVEAGETTVPALAVYDPEVGAYEIVNFHIQNPETSEWQVDTSIKKINSFGFRADGGYWVVEGQHILRRSMAGVPKGEHNNDINTIMLSLTFDVDEATENMNKLGKTPDSYYYNGVLFQDILDYIEKGARVEESIRDPYRFSLYDDDGHLVKRILLDEIFPGIDYPVYVKLQIFAASNGQIYIYYPGTIYVLSQDLQVLYTIKIPDEWYMFERNGNVNVNGINGLPKLTLDENGNARFVAFTNISSTGGKSDPALFKIDDETHSLINETNLTASTAYEAFAGPLFAMYYKRNDGLYALSADGEAVKLFEWLKVEVKMSDVEELFILSPDKMYMPVRNATTREWEIHLITNESADDDREVIRIAYDADGSGVKSSDLAAYIREYNATNDAYRIEFVEYTTDKVGRTANEKLISDLLTGEAPDMILFGSSITPEKFVRQGLLIDMYSLMDGDYKKKDFLPCVRTPFENNKGELPYLVTDYIIETMIGKSSNLSGKKSWTFDEMLKVNASLGKDQTLMSLTMREGDSVPLTLLKTLLPNMLEKFIDYEKETCNFGEDFKKLLEFCKTAKVAALNGYISPSYYHDNEVLLNTSSYALQTFLANHHVNFAGDYTYIGYPEANGSVVKARTTFGITKRSDVADGAWEFIELYLDAQTEKWEDAKERTSFDYVSALTFPATYAAFDAMVENISQYTHFFNFGMVEGDGKRLEQGKYNMTSMLTPAADDEAGQKQLADTKLKFALAYTVTEEDVKALYSLVEGITTAYMDDPAAMNIILEDANDYFIGRKSLDEVVKLIRNRVGILVSE